MDLSFVTCWFCKGRGHRKRQCISFIQERYYCLLCETNGMHRTKDCQSSVTVNCKSVQVQTKPKTHNKYSQAESVNMDVYINAVSDYKRIESELYGQREGNQMYKEKIAKLEVERLDDKTRLKTQRKLIKSLDNDIRDYSDKLYASTSESSLLESKLQESVKQITALSSRSNEYSAIIADIEHKLKDRTQELEIYTSVIRSQQIRVDDPVKSSTENSSFWGLLGNRIFHKTSLYNPYTNLTNQPLIFDV